MTGRDYPHFTGRNVPIEEIAEATGLETEEIITMLKDRDFEFGIQLGDNRESERFYCSDKKVWEETGYFREVKPDEEKT